MQMTEELKARQVMVVQNLDQLPYDVDELKNILPKLKALE